MKSILVSLLTLLAVHGYATEVSVMINPNPAAPLTAIVSVSHTTADSVAVVFRSHNHSVEYGRAAALSFAVIGLKANREYEATISMFAKGKCLSTSAGHKVHTPELPNHPALMPKIVVSTMDSAMMEQGYTLFNPRRDAPRTNTLDDSFNQAYGLLMAIDHRGDVVWYYTCNSRISDFDILDNGHISYLQQDNTLVEIDWAGNVIHSWYSALRPQRKPTQAVSVEQSTMHHDVVQLPGGNRVALGTEWRVLDNYWTGEHSDTKGTEKVMGDVVYEFTPEGQVVWTWNVFDYLNPYVAGYETFHAYWQRRGYPDVRADWSHANAVVYDPQSDALLVNFRHLSLIVKIDRKTKDIVWAFGHHTDILKDKSKFITLESGQFPWHQHSPEISPSGTLLFFNNDNYKAFLPDTPEPVAQSYSYANEYRIDQARMTATAVWNSKQAQDKHVVSVAMGDVDYLPHTGNILVAYGQLLDQSYVPQMQSWEDRQGTTWTMMREYTHTTPARVVWEVRLEPLTPTSPVGWTLFGAQRFDLLMCKPRP